MKNSKPQINKQEEKDFLKSINKAIADNRHVDYLKAVLKKYDEYKKVFDENFTDTNPKEAVYKFRVNYLLKKSLWRDIEILGNQTFCDLAEEIIASMEWDNDHMHGFDLQGYSYDMKNDHLLTGSSISFFAPSWEDDPHTTFKSDEINIADMDYKKQSKIGFIFDYGDGHRFDIIFKDHRPLDKKENKRNFPRVIDMRGIAPEQYPDWGEGE